MESQFPDEVLGEFSKISNLLICYLANVLMQCMLFTVPMEKPQVLCLT